MTPVAHIKSFSELTQLKVIGEGALAKVYRAYYKDPQSKKYYVYAVKVFNTYNVSKSGDNCLVI
jgi:hypothetical protein